MKKIITMLLIIMVTLSMVACSASGGNPTAEEGEKGLSRGIISGNVYTNEYMGFCFTKPETWEYATDAEIAQMVNLSVENILGENFLEALENNESVYDMLVYDNVSGTSVSVAYENLSKSFSYNISVQQYLDAIENQFSSNTSMKLVFTGDIQKITLGNTEFFKAKAKNIFSGMTIDQVFYLKKVDGYMFAITVTLQGYTAAEIEAMFGPV